jgi:hypothetical protein
MLAPSKSQPKITILRIKCLNCGRSEEVTLDLFAKILGVATAGFGYWAWVSFLFAGTGFAMAICIAIMAGGAATLVFKDEIVDWIVNRGYERDKATRNARRNARIDTGLL